MSCARQARSNSFIGKSPRESLSANLVPGPQQLYGKCSSTFNLFKSLLNDISNVSGAQTIYTCSIYTKTLVR